MNIDKLKQLTDEAHELESIIIKLSGLGRDQYLHVQIHISDGYNSNELDRINTNEDVALSVALVEFYNNQLNQIKDEIRKVTKEV